MALFNRKQTSSPPPMPPAIETYYQPEKRDRAWMAWLLAIVTLIVTVLVAGGLFLGGRWAYHKLRNQPKPTKVSVQQEPRTKSPAAAPTSSPAPASQPAQTNSPKPSTPPPTSSTPTATTPTAPANSSLPNTGPGENMVAIFVLTSVAGTIFYKRRFSTSPR